jgi:hypothetical protein
MLSDLEKQLFKKYEDRWTFEEYLLFLENVKNQSSDVFLSIIIDLLEESDFRQTILGGFFWHKSNRLGSFWEELSLRKPGHIVPETTLTQSNEFKDLKDLKDLKYIAILAGLVAVFTAAATWFDFIGFNTSKVAALFPIIFSYVSLTFSFLYFHRKQRLRKNK